MEFSRKRIRFLFAGLFSILTILGDKHVAAVADEKTALRPMLVVAVSVDQLAYDYLQRFERNFSPHGFFRRCDERGLWFTNCHHRHAFTYTAPGHAVQLTGCYASEHGIVENDWFDRGLGKKVYCVADPSVKLIGTTIADTPASPRNLLADTVGDQLKAATNGEAKVFGVAIKDRASILMTGHRANAAYWMSNDGKWITSDYYRRDLPGYLREINEGSRVNRFAGQPWKLLLEPVAYLHGATENSFGERPFAGLSADFPHVLVEATHKNYIKQVAGTPFGNDATLEAAWAVFESEQLGRDDTPDLLCINLSSNDYVGHAFGPDSLEAEDMTYHTDVQLGEFFRRVTTALGERPWVLALTADHAVCPVPEISQKRGMPAVRNPLGKANSKGDYTELSQQLEKQLRSILHVDSDEPPPLVQSVTDNEVFLVNDHPALAGARFVEAQNATRDFLLKHPAIAAAVTREQLLSGGVATKLEQMFRRSFFPQRSGDVLFALRPYYINGEAAATHGSPWQYDTHVPLLLLAGGKWSAGDAAANTSPGPLPCLPAGRYDQLVSPAQLAPTLARLLHINAPAMCVEEALLIAR